MPDLWPMAILVSLTPTTAMRVWVELSGRFTPRNKHAFEPLLPEDSLKNEQLDKLIAE
jgi:hypothetical protein